jgi:hypothetical protein
MLVGTYVMRGDYVTVAVEAKGAATGPTSVVLERPGAAAARVTCELESFAVALRHAEALVLARGGWLGAEAEGLAGSPVERDLARSMFEGELKRFGHVPARWPVGG